MAPQGRADSKSSDETTKDEGKENGKVNAGFDDTEDCTDKDSQEKTKRKDPWSTDLDLKDKGKKWSELNSKEKCIRVLRDYMVKPAILIGMLYLFICSLDFLSSAFRLLGGKAAGQAFAENEVLKNPIAGLMVGVLVTVLVQSSSTTTSIVVSMVAGGVLYVRTAIPIVMGANIGTTVTNSIVSMGHVGDQDEFRRAFGAATVHDWFNWLSVLVLLPLESAAHYLEILSGLIVDSMPLDQYTSGNQDLLKTITKPFTKLVISVDTSKITDIAEGAEDVGSLIKIWCKSNTTYSPVNVTYSNVTTVGGVNVTNNYTVEEMVASKVGVEKCVFMFMDVAGVWSDELIGAILLAIALVILCTCLIVVVKILNSLLSGRIASALKKFVNADFPGKLSFLTGYLAILIGAGLTILVQSSSILTSTLTPLVGVGVLSLERMYPLALGANVGTTATGILASLAASGNTIVDALQVSFCHLFFNLSGILLWYPIPILRKAPINIAMFLGNETAKYRWLPLVYIISMYFLLPGLLLGLSLAGWYVLLAVAGPFGVIILIVLVIKLFQAKCPRSLPPVLRTWKWLPVYFRSLKPLDTVIRKIFGWCKCCKSTQKVSTDIEMGKTTLVSSINNDLDKKDSQTGDINPAFVNDSLDEKS